MKFLVSILIFACISFYLKGQPNYRLKQVNDSTSSVSLAKGYTLIIISSDNWGSVFLKHGNNLKQLTDYYELWTWLEMDGTNYFMTGSGGRGSGNPENVRVIRKDSGNTVYSVSAWMLYYDSANSIVVFDNHREGRVANRIGDSNKQQDYANYFTIYNLNTNKYELYNEPTDNSELNGNWEVINLTRSTLKIKYMDINNKEKTIAYSRVKKH